jgi:hypothetical protein
MLFAALSLIEPDALTKLSFEPEERRVTMGEGGKAISVSFSKLSFERENGL